MKKITQKQYEDRLSSRDIIPLSEYVSSREKASFKCKNCSNEWVATPNSVVNGGRGCPSCARIIVSKKNKKKNIILSDNGSWLEIDISTPSHPNSTMLIDSNDWERMLSFGIGRVCARLKKGTHTTYASTHLPGGKTKEIHRLIMPESKMLDHKNGNGCDNRRSNLREVSYAQNNRNSRRRVDNKSGHSGVFYVSEINKWRAYICENGKTKTLGHFAKKKDAVNSRKKAEIEIYGEYRKKGR